MIRERERPVGQHDRGPELLDPRRFDRDRRQQRRSEQIDLGVGRQHPVRQEIIVELRRADGSLIAPAGILVLVLAKNDVAFEIDLHRLPGIIGPQVARRRFVRALPFRGSSRAR